MSVRKILNQSQVSVFHDKQILVNSVSDERRKGRKNEAHHSFQLKDSYLEKI